MSAQSQVQVEFRNGREVLPGTDIPIGDLTSGAVVERTKEFVCRYVVLPPAARLPVALWAIATHTFESFDAFPYLSLSSPTPRCGKTRLLEVLELLCARPWRGTAPSEAALFRFIEERQPTLLLDEVESLGQRKASERDSAVLAILNAGYKKGQTVPRCKANSHELQTFRVYSPKAFACIGHLPPTLSDRSIIVPMQRRGPGERVERFRFSRAQREAEPIRHQIGEGVKAVADEIREAYLNLPELPFLSDRDEEIFSPLFAVCAVLYPSRLGELSESAQALCAAKTSDTVDDSLSLRLLDDLMRLWPEGELYWATADMLTALKSEPESPWSEMELTARRLARMLRPFEIVARNIRTDYGVKKGYLLESVKVAHSRYIGPESATSATSRENTGGN
ncbi:MAG TPA: DUF3631 domain-containing protein [Bryobacteraceae bacterium]|nr:DUF3631 domain-containing protein [Bryobacteraceae bacterium]